MASQETMKDVNLYYLGGLPEDDGPQYVICGGETFVLPPKGESLRIPLYKAEDLMRRYNVKGAFMFSLTKLGTAPTPAPERKFTRDELLMMLSNMPAESEEEVELDLSGEPDAQLAETSLEVPPGENDEPASEEPVEETQPEAAQEPAPATEPTPKSETAPAPRTRKKTEGAK
jgi:hypothetical protein